MAPADPAPRFVICLHREVEAAPPNPLAPRGQDPGCPPPAVAPLSVSATDRSLCGERAAYGDDAEYLFPGALPKGAGPPTPGEIRSLGSQRRALHPQPATYSAFRSRRPRPPPTQVSVLTQPSEPATPLGVHPITLTEGSTGGRVFQPLLWPVFLVPSLECPLRGAMCYARGAGVPTSRAGTPARRDRPSCLL